MPRASRSAFIRANGTKLPVFHHIVRYANIMGRENVVAGTHCGYGNRVYPDIAWAKMKAMADGAAVATEQLWRC